MVNGRIFLVEPHQEFGCKDWDILTGVRSDKICTCKWYVFVHGGYASAAKTLALVGTLSAVSVATALLWEQPWQCWVLPAFPMLCLLGREPVDHRTKFYLDTTFTYVYTKYSLFIEVESSECINSVHKNEMVLPLLAVCYEEIPGVSASSFTGHKILHNWSVCLEGSVFNLCNHFKASTWSINKEESF